MKIEKEKKDQGEDYKISTCTLHYKRVRGFVYPVFAELQALVRSKITLDDKFVSDLSTQIEHLMLANNKNDAVLLLELKKRGTKKSASVPKAGAKIIITSLNDIERGVRDAVQKLNSLERMIPENGFRLSSKLAVINTLEWAGDPGSGDEYWGF